MKRLLILFILFHSISLFSQNTDEVTTMIIKSVKLFSSQEKASHCCGSGICINYISLDGLPLYFPVDGLPDYRFLRTNTLSSLPFSQRKDFRRGTNVLYVSTELMGNTLVVRLCIKQEQLKGLRTRKTCIIYAIEYLYRYSCTTNCWQFIEEKAL